MASLVLFCISTIGCLYASDIYVFIFFRLLQGLSRAGGVVISKAIATDLYEGRELTRFFSMLSSVQGIAPVSYTHLDVYKRQGFYIAISFHTGVNHTFRTDLRSLDKFG